MGRYLLTVAELGRVLGLSDTQTRKVIASTDFPLTPVPGLLVTNFRRVDVEQWLGCPIDDDLLVKAR